MKKKIVMPLVLLILMCPSYTLKSQVGIGVINPTSLLEIKSNPTKFNKSIEISNSSNSNIFNLYANGNIEFFVK